MINYRDRHYYIQNIIFHDNKCWVGAGIQVNDKVNVRETQQWRQTRQWNNFPWQQLLKFHFQLLQIWYSSSRSYTDIPIGAIQNRNKRGQKIRSRGDFARGMKECSGDFRKRLHKRAHLNFSNSRHFISQMVEASPGRRVCFARSFLSPVSLSSSDSRRVSKRSGKVLHDSPRCPILRHLSPFFVLHPPFRANVSFDANCHGMNGT